MDWGDPKGWEVERLKYFSEVVLSSVDRHILEEELGVSICHYPDVYNNEVINKTTFLPSGTCTESEFEKFHLRTGNILLTKDSESPDDIGVPTFVEEELENTVCGYHLSQITPIRNNIFPKFLYRYIQSDFVSSYFETEANGITRYGLGKPSIENVSVPLPPLSEQKQISDYLDRKTQQIDALIKKTERKIELLKEQRSSLINQCVTKGLDPNVEMKDSGVEWIGEIPRGWKLSRIKYVKSKEKYSLVDGPFGSDLKSEHFVDDGTVVVIESGFITKGSFIQTRDFKKISHNHFEKVKRSQCREGDIIIAKIGEYYGMCSVLPKLNSESVISGNCCKLTVSAEVNRDFVHLFLLFLRSKGVIQLEVNQTGQPFISLDVINNLQILLPPKNEQNQIINFLNERLQNNDRVVDTETKRIELLKEYRQSLISNVVTGKIDVRDEVIR